MSRASRRPGVTQTNGSSVQHTSLAQCIYTTSRHTRLCCAHALGTAHIHILWTHATLRGTPPQSTWHTPSVDGLLNCLMTRERPACKTHTNSISVFSTGRPMQLRTNRRPHAPAPSSGSPVKLRIKRRPDAPSPSSVNHLKLRTKCRLICLLPGSSGNPVHLRITRVGQATCHQCTEIRRVAEGSFSSPHSRTLFPRIWNKQKGPYFLSLLS